MKIIYIKIAVLFLCSMIILSCSKEEDEVIPGKPIITKENTPPETFKVNIMKVSFNFAFIDWEPAIDTDDDTLYYTVYLGDSAIAIDMRVDTILKITNLTSETQYKGKIEVTDKKSPKVIVPFTFKTTKYLITFNKHIETHDLIPFGSTIEQTNDGGYIIGGGKIIDFEFRTVIVKYDSSGYIQWHTVLDHYNSQSVQIKQTQDNGFVLVDFAKIVKLDQNGKVQWEYPDGLRPLSRYGSVIETANHNYLVLKTEAVTADEFPIIIKFDASGNKLWEKPYRNSDYKLNYIEKTSDGNYIILGSVNSYIVSELIVLKINDKGEILWEKTYNHDGYDFGNKIKPTSDEGFIICSSNMDERNLQSAKIMKLDKGGNLQWDKVFLWYYEGSFTNSIEEVSDGGFMVCGSDGYQRTKAIIAKLDVSGELVWKKDFYPPDLLDYMWFMNDLQQTSDKGIVMLMNKSYLYSGPEDQIGGWIMKCDGNGDFN